MSSQSSKLEIIPVSSAKSRVENIKKSGLRYDEFSVFREDGTVIMMPTNEKPDTEDDYYQYVFKEAVKLIYRHTMVEEKATDEIKSNDDKSDGKVKAKPNCDTLNVSDAAKMIAVATTPTDMTDLLHPEKILKLAETTLVGIKHSMTMKRHGCTTRLHWRTYNCLILVTIA
jgi:hypothetical protein